MQQFFSSPQPLLTTHMYVCVPPSSWSRLRSIKKGGCLFPRFHLFGKFKFVDFGNVDLPELRVLGLVNYAKNASKCVDRQLRKTSIMLAARPVLKSKYFEPPFPFSLFVSLMLVRGREGPCIPSPLPPPVPPSGRGWLVSMWSPSPPVPPNSQCRPFKLPLSHSSADRLNPPSLFRCWCCCFSISFVLVLCSTKPIPKNYLQKRLFSTKNVQKLH